MLKVYVEQIQTPEQVAEEGLKKSEKVLFREFQSDVLTGRDVVQAMVVIIDQPGWKILEKIDAKSRKMESISITQDLETERFDKMALISNGRNSISLLDWEEHSTVVRHDPVIKVVGPDAPELATIIIDNMLVKLTEKLVKISLDSAVAKDISRLIGVDIDTITSIKVDLEASADQAINDLMKLHDNL
jgi:hypothetical protein